MKDYSGYHELTMKQKIINDGQRLFQAQLDKEGSDAKIDGTDCRIIIHRISTPINELKEERKVMCLGDIAINRGSIILADSKTYLVTSAIETNMVYKKAKMVEVTYTLKLRADDGVVYNIPSVLRRGSTTTLGTNEIKWITLPEGKMEAQIPNTEITNNITRNKYNRFIIAGSAWHVSSVDKVTQNGIINLLLQEQVVDTVQDNVIDNIADDTKYKYTVEIVNGNMVNLGFGQSLQLNVRVLQDNILLTNPAVVYSVVNSAAIVVTDEGLVTPMQAGNHTVTVSYNNASAEILIRAGAAPKYNYYADISGQHTIKIGDMATYTVKFMNNSNEAYAPAVWTLTSNDGVSPTTLVSIESTDVDTGTCVIKTNGNFEKGTFWIWARNIDNTIIGHYEAHVVARF